MARWLTRGFAPLVELILAHVGVLVDTLLQLPHNRLRIRRTKAKGIRETKEKGKEKRKVRLPRVEILAPVKERHHAFAMRVHQLNALTPTKKNQSLATREAKRRRKQKKVKRKEN